MLSESLQERGHRVVLLCKEDAAMQQDAVRRGIETRTPGLSGKFNPLVALRIARVAREIGADVIHTHLSTASQWGGFAGRVCGIPVVSHVHAMNSRYFFMLADRMVACSEGVRRHIINQGVSGERVTTVYNGIDLRRFEKVMEAAEVRRSLGLPGTGPVIGCVAHLSPKKGQRYLLHAVALLRDRWPDLHCLLVGEGDMTDTLAALARELGIADRLHLLGFRGDVISVVNAMDVLVLPSVAKEGLGLALIEAALLGKPTLASNAPGIDEALEDGVSGFLVKPGNPEELAARLDFLLSDASLCDRMGRAGRQRALETFSIPAMTDQMEAIYYELRGKRRHES
jgi:glycosyltransferase involved in cell wall biosynthesis